MLFLPREEGLVSAWEINLPFPTVLKASLFVLLRAGVDVLKVDDTYTPDLSLTWCSALNRVLPKLRCTWQALVNVTLSGKRVFAEVIKLT